MVCLGVNTNFKWRFENEKYFCKMYASLVDRGWKKTKTIA